MLDSGHSFTAYFKRATSPLVVLALLRDRSMYGYEISAEMKQRSRGEYTLAVLYPVLYRLQEQGYVRLKEPQVVDGRSRSYYVITEAGRRHLEQCLIEFQELSAVFLEMTEAVPQA